LEEAGHRDAARRGNDASRRRLAVRDCRLDHQEMLAEEDVLILQKECVPSEYPAYGASHGNRSPIEDRRIVRDHIDAHGHSRI